MMITTITVIVMMAKIILNDILLQKIHFYLFYKRYIAFTF